MRGFTPGADVTGGYEFTDVGSQSRPPESTSDEIGSAVDARVAGEPTGVPPLEDFGTDRGRNKKAIRRASTRAAVSTLSGSNHRLETPRHYSYDLGWREDGLGLFGRARRLRVETRERVSTGILGTGSERQSEVETVEKQGPPGLSGVKSLCRSDVNEVLVVGPHNER